LQKYTLKMKTLVIGASHKPERYSNKAMQMLKDHGHKVLALGRRSRSFDNWQIDEGKPTYQDVDTVTLYLNYTHQQDYYDYLKSLKPRRVIFNPGTENPELEGQLEKEGIQTERACTLVLLSTGQY
jgi:predicted CoA-binding protein